MVRGSKDDNYVVDTAWHSIEQRVQRPQPGYATEHKQKPSLSTMIPTRTASIADYRKKEHDLKRPQGTACADGV